MQLFIHDYPLKMCLIFFSLMQTEAGNLGAIVSVVTNTSQKRYACRHTHYRSNQDLYVPKTNISHGFIYMILFYLQLYIFDSAVNVIYINTVSQPNPLIQSDTLLNSETQTLVYAIKTYNREVTHTFEPQNKCLNLRFIVTAKHSLPTNVWYTYINVTSKHKSFTILNCTSSCH